MVIVMPGRSGILIEPAAAGAFIAGYKQVLLRVCGADPRSDRDTLQSLACARHRIKENPALLENAVAELEENEEPVGEEVLRAIRSLQFDDWVYLRDTRNYSVFVQLSGEYALGVLALTQRIRDIVGTSGVVIETGVVRYCGRFVCDGLVSRFVHLGPGYRRSFSDAYRSLRAKGRFDVECAA
jgi:hypothetical protein